MPNRKLYIFLIITLSILVIILTFRLENFQKKLAEERRSCAREMFDLASEKPDVALRLYQLMKDVDMVLRMHNINYWASGGTLIGAVRHKGIIPYDDDLDIEIDSSDSKNLEPALLDLEKLGYIISQDRKNWVIISSQDKCSGKFYFLDLFSMTIKGDKLKFSGDRATKAFGHTATLKKSEIFPLKQYKFGDIYITGAHNPIRYLKKYYSEDILTKACIWPKHGNSPIKKRRCVELEGEMLEPLKPTGTLIDNSKILDLKNAK